MKRRHFFFWAATAGVLALSPLAPAAPALKVASTHPLVSDVLRQVGGHDAAVVDLLKSGGDAHHFEPTASDLQALRGVAAVFASGKHLENYLDKLRDSLGAGVPIIEVGKPIPSLKIDPGNGLFLCCPEHASGGIDPHWWHSADNMARAARYVAGELGKLDPPHTATYKQRGEAAAKHFAALKSWAQQQLSAIPRADRKLVTAHASFGYFCKEYGFKFVPLLGLAKEEDFSPQYVAEAVKVIREQRIKAAFPESQTNPKILTEIVRETGIKVGDPLIADGTAPEAGGTFEGMLKHNVNALVKALKP